MCQDSASFCQILVHLLCPWERPYKTEAKSKGITMAEKKEVTVNKDLLQENLSIMHGIYLKSIDVLHSDMLVLATKASLDGEEFDPAGIEFKIGKCNDCENEKDEKSDKPRAGKDLDSDFIEGLLGVIEKTVKNKNPSMENLEKLVASLDELFKKKK